MICKLKMAVLAIIVYPFLISAISACPQCRAAVQKNIYNHNFSNNLLVILLPLIILGSVGVATFYAGNLKKKNKNESNGQK